MTLSIYSEDIDSRIYIRPLDGQIAVDLGGDDTVPCASMEEAEEMSRNYLNEHPEALPC